MKALLIEFNRSTGKRAGNISPIDPNLRCQGWQKLDVEPALEIRLITDDRDVSQYEGIEGVTILEDKKAINNAIDELQLERYSIDNEILFRLDVDEKKISMKAYSGWKSKDVLKDLHNKKTLGIRKRSPKKV